MYKTIYIQYTYPRNPVIPNNPLVQLVWKAKAHLHMWAAMYIGGAELVPVLDASGLKRDATNS